jgi:hypothetical protein
MRLQGTDRATVEHQMRTADLSREAYVRHWYHVDPRDPALYHLLLDSTAIELEACVELIAQASASRMPSARDEARAERGQPAEGPRPPVAEALGAERDEKKHQ